MQCCVQGRARLKHYPTQAASPAHAQATVNPASGSGSSIVLSYKEAASILVHGPATGRQYLFSATRSTQSVDRRDAEGLLSTGLFRRAG
jgi:hypothetical protein